MRKTTKILSLLLTLAMMLTMAVPMTVSAAFTDVPADHHYYDAITNLSSEGILNGFEDGSFKPGEPVTRAQFTKIICYALSVGNLTYSEEERSIFSDLAPEHWAANNIVTAYKQGIINGMGDGTFAPEAGVQYEQAVKMVVCALGYSQARAEAAGGYPGGYMSLANQAKLLKGITDAKMYEVMNRGAVAQLIDNMLDADQIQDGQPSGSIREEVSTSKSVDGQLVAGYGVALYDDTANGNELENCRKNEVIVELGSARWSFDISKINGFDIYEYLGRNVTVYYEQESGVTVQEATSIALQPRKNETTKIELDMIHAYDSSSIEYYTDSDRNDTETIDFQIDADVLWNGQYDARSIKQLLDYDSNYTKPGYITLVSSQANQSADVAFLKTYDTIVVDTVDSNNSKVFAKNASGSWILDVTDRSKSVSIKMNGSDYALSSIRTNHILSISESANHKVVEVLVSTKVATGTIESMTTTPQTQIKLNTGNTLYTVAPTVYDAGTNVSGSSAMASLVPGKYVTISLDAFGKIARFIISAESTYNYGYISALEHGTTSRPEIQVMIYKPSASNMSLTGTVYTFAERVKVDGTNYNMEDDMHTILTKLETSAGLSGNSATIEGVAPTNAQYSQPVRYTLDRSNKIDGILTVASATPGESSTELEVVNKTGSGGILCKVDASTFDQYRITGSTPVLYIPANRASSSYSSKSNMFFDEGKSYYVQFANVSGTNVVGCVYLYGVVGSGSGEITAQITEENKPLIVLDRSQKLHLDNTETYIKVMDITTGTEHEYYENTIDLDTLAIGDVVRLAIGMDDYVDALEILADADGVVAGTFNYGSGVYAKYDGDGTGIMAEFRALLATVKSKEGSTFVVVPGYDGSVDNSFGETFTASESLPIFKIDTAAANAANKVKTSSVGELIGYVSDAASASNVLIYTVEGVIKGVIIFE